MNSSESPEHKRIKDLISTRLHEWTGASLEEYPSSGHELDVFAVTPDGVSIYVEIIWSATSRNFHRDMSMVQQSDADIKVVVGSPKILSREDYLREFSKIAISQRRTGVAMHGELIDGMRIIEDDNYLETEFKDIVLSLIKQVQSQAKIIPSLREIAPPEIPHADKIQEQILSNLFPVKKYPLTIFRAPTKARVYADVFRKLGAKIISRPFILKSKEIYTFENLKKTSSPFRPIISTNGIIEEPVCEWIKESDKRNDLIRLLNLHVREFCLNRGMYYDRAHRRFVCLLKNGEDNTFTWRAGSKFVRRTVAKRVYGKEGDLLYCRHYAANLRFMFVDDDLFLKIEPTITFTRDGYHTLRLSKLASFMSRWLPKQYNSSYLLLVRFWAKYLSKLDIAISIPAGEQKIEVAATPVIAQMNVGIAEETIPSAKSRKRKNARNKETV
ncbi:MAG: hypothetical protein ACETVN_02120 [Asgard group archaeon]